VNLLKFLPVLFEFWKLLLEFVPRRDLLSFVQFFKETIVDLSAQFKMFLQFFLVLF